jgi:hypothetical protein
MKATVRLLAAIALLAAPGLSHAQDSAGEPAQPATAPQASPAAQPSPSPAPPATLENTISAGESSDEPPQRKLVHWNEYHGPYFTIRVGAGPGRPSHPARNLSQVAASYVEQRAYV